MTIWNWLIVLAFAGGVTLLYVRLNRRTKQMLAKSDERSKHEFEIRRTRLSGIISVLMGTVFVAAMLVNWGRVPPGNEPFAVGFIVFGLASILHGVYKFYKLRR